MDPSLIRVLLGQTEVVRVPVRTLSTFGATVTPYHLVSPVEDLEGRTRLRRGTVRSEKPVILTAETLAQRFEGFGAEAQEFAQWLGHAYRDVLRALEYNFKNEDFAARVISERPETVVDRIQAELEAGGARGSAVIRCPDAAWSLALMKFTLDDAARSFPANVRDLDRRGLFSSPEGRERELRRREIEALFAAARADGRAREALGRKLREYGLLSLYEDRFLSLFQ